MRYYWTDPVIQRAQQTLLTNLSEQPIPLTLISQYLPQHYQLVRSSQLNRQPGGLLIAGVAAVLRQYSQACQVSGGPGGNQ
jgi:D-tagatose-1,6-bisphosphate aldolase subunit GatZ/KbaZ